MPIQAQALKLVHAMERSGPSEKQTLRVDAKLAMCLGNLTRQSKDTMFQRMTALL